jgi:hypothetical protein
MNKIKQQDQFKKIVREEENRRNISPKINEKKFKIDFTIITFNY